MTTPQDKNVSGPNTASEKEKAEESRENVAPDTENLDGKNDSGVEPEVHNSDLPGTK